MNIKNNFVCTAKHQYNEKFNPYQTGHGVHKSAKYPIRSNRKAEVRKEIRRAGY